ncbi:hypothetical protein [Heyndrickxia oleronia]|uniref:hypothetical protein n=1 Tax=Heyndrickxia oleronia TaxID=38875 RepID=UPI003F85592A
MKKPLFSILLCMFIAIITTGCNSVEDKLLKTEISKMENDKKLTKEEKKLIKESQLINYVVETYGTSIDITKYEVIPEEPEEAPPLIIIYIKDHKGRYLSSVNCEMNYEEKGKLDCKPYDTYFTNLMNKEATNYIKPLVAASFGNLKKEVEHFAFINIDNASEKNLTFREKPNYKKLKGKLPICVSVRLIDEKLKAEAYYNEMYHFIQNFNNQSHIKLDSNCNGVSLYIRGKIKDNFGNADVKAITVKQPEINNIKQPNDLKKFTKTSNLFEAGYEM